MRYTKPRCSRLVTETFEDVEVVAILDIHGHEREFSFSVVAEGTYEPDDYEDKVILYHGGWSFEIKQVNPVAMDDGEEFIFVDESALIKVLSECLDEDALIRSLDRRD